MQQVARISRKIHKKLAPIIVIQAQSASITSTFGKSKGTLACKTFGSSAHNSAASSSVRAGAGSTLDSVQLITTHPEKNIKHAKHKGRKNVVKPLQSPHLPKHVCSKGTFKCNPKSTWTQRCLSPPKMDSGPLHLLCVRMRQRGGGRGEGQPRSRARI